MFCSTIIPTINRPTLPRAVDSVLVQDIPGHNFEIIVVNDSGKPLAQENWQKSEHVRVINTNKRERSVARNTGAAVAKGKFLHFLDDDDWLTSGAFQSLLALTQTTSVGWYYGGSQLMDRRGKPLIQLHHGLDGNAFIQVLAGEWIPLQASLISSDMFFSVGGFNPLISGPEDIDLLRRIALHSDIAGTSEVVVNIEMGEEGSSTDYGRHAEASRFAREFILDEDDAFTRMRLSANSSYWYGRLVRAYLTSMVWNAKHNRPFTALSRAFHGLKGIIASWNNVFSRKFWNGLAYKYESDTFARGLAAVKLVYDGEDGQL